MFLKFQKSDTANAGIKFFILQYFCKELKVVDLNLT